MTCSKLLKKEHEAQFGPLGPFGVHSILKNLFGLLCWWVWMDLHIWFIFLRRHEWHAMYTEVTYLTQLMQWPCRNINSDLEKFSNMVTGMKFTLKFRSTHCNALLPREPEQWLGRSPPCHKDGELFRCCMLASHLCCKKAGHQCRKQAGRKGMNPGTMASRESNTKSLPLSLVPAYMCQIYKPSSSWSAPSNTDQEYMLFNFCFNPSLVPLKLPLWQASSNSNVCNFVRFVYLKPRCCVPAIYAGYLSIGQHEKTVRTWKMLGPCQPL